MIDLTAPAVLYICVDARGRTREEGEAIAVQEGLHFAERHRQLSISNTVRDNWGETDPRQRPGWLEVRDMVQYGHVRTVIMRWPSMLSPRHELRYLETEHLRQHGAHLLFSLGSLSGAAGGGGIR
ncbi:hypothetical protein AB0O20_33995 [Streptomyces kronopolitis]|uniref:hypothetical protein n=1 Tax=Streptomyces kronopolitis TaxID=1612435 RepID=UPI003437A1F5